MACRGEANNMSRPLTQMREAGWGGVGCLGIARQFPLRQEEGVKNEAGVIKEQHSRYNVLTWGLVW